MLYKTIFRGAITLNLQLFSRSYASMAPSGFALDRSVFHEGLYSHLREFWFQGIAPNATAGSFEALKKWYGMGSEEEKAAFDEQCRSHFGRALEAVGPGKLALPTYTSEQDDIQCSDELAAPFMAEVEDAQREDEKRGADTLLSLILLLDQIPRNTLRDQAGLRLVYTHYDRLALALLRSSLVRTPSLLRHPAYLHRPVIQLWYFMPLMHSEAVGAHELRQQLVSECSDKVDSEGDKQAAFYLQKSAEAEEKHMDPLRRFGRYPYRNEALGRETSAEEMEYLKTADTFGVKQKGEEKEKEKGKDEL